MSKNGPSNKDLEAIEIEGFMNLDLGEYGIEKLVKEVGDDIVLIENDPISYCKAQEVLDGGIKTHGEGIKESDNISVGKLKFIPINDFKGY